jgi:hypothetical protein
VQFGKIALGTVEESVNVEEFKPGGLHNGKAATRFTWEIFS